jgi:hypothetical protein
MKIGMNFSQCLIDLYEGRVTPDEVLVIMVRIYRFDPRKTSEWDRAWHSFLDGIKGSHSIYDRLPNEFRKLVITLDDLGKLHMPRASGSIDSFPIIPYVWLDCAVPVDDLENLPSVKQAWNHYQMIAGLCK